MYWKLAYAKVKFVVFFSTENYRRLSAEIKGERK
jgi:hypothetical protein